MAKRGQKFIKYTDDERKEILNKYINGIPSLRLAKEYGIPAKTIRNWKRKYQNPDLYPGLGNKRGRYKNSKLTKEDYKERYEILKKYRAFLKEQREKK
jgi:uncharacterized protein YjcR